MEEKNTKYLRNQELALIIKNTYGKPELRYEYNAACEEFLKNYKLLIYKYANNYSSSNKKLIFEDLLATFQQAAIKACTTYDEAKGANITTYLNHALTTASLNFREKYDSSLIRIPIHLYLQIHKEHMKVENEGINPTMEIMCERLKPLKIKPYAIIAYYNLSKIQSTSEPVKNSKDDSIELEDTLTNLRENPEEIAIENNANEELFMALEFMPENSREVINLTYFKQLTQVEIAEKFNHTQGHVSRLIKNSIMTLKILYEPENLLAIKTINKLRTKHKKIVKLNEPDTLENLIKGENISDETLYRAYILSKYANSNGSKYLKLLNLEPFKVSQLSKKIKNDIKNIIVTEPCEKPLQNQTSKNLKVH